MKFRYIFFKFLDEISCGKRYDENALLGNISTDRL